MARLKRLYAPYTKVNGKWVRATWKDGEERPAFRKEKAVRIYQDWLLAPFMQGIDEIRELRPIPVKSNEYDTNRDWEQV